MTMSSDQYETGNSSVKISDGAKGSTVEVKVYARPVPENVYAAEALKRLLGSVEVPTQQDAQVVVGYIKQLRAAVPDVKAASVAANELHLMTAAKVESNGGIIAYDPDKNLLKAWVEMEHAKIGANIQAAIDEDGDAADA